MAVFLETGSVLTPKNLWYTGLSRIEKYPLMQALDKKRSRWNGWISMPLWAQRVPGIGGWLWHLRRMRSNMPGSNWQLIQTKQILYYFAFLHEDSYPKNLRCNWVIPLSCGDGGFILRVIPHCLSYQFRRKTIRQQSGN